jgi:hypothetical protein
MQMEHIVSRAWMAGIVVLAAMAALAVAARAADAPAGGETAAIRTTDFLNSIGVDSTFPDRGDRKSTRLNSSHP